MKSILVTVLQLSKQPKPSESESVVVVVIIIINTIPLSFFFRNLLVNLGLFAAGVWVARNLSDFDLMSPQPVT